MPDIHVPKLEDDDEEIQPAAGEPPGAAPPPPGPAAHRSKSLLRIGMEVLLIGVGVFLGLAGEQWRESAHHRELADSSLRRFRSEFQTNRQNVASVRDKHVAKLAALRTYLQSDAKKRLTLGEPDAGLDPAFFEHAAWDVALATQSLAYVDSSVAFSIAHVYAVQQQLDDLTHAMTLAMYMTSNNPAFLANVTTYFGDCTLIEPRLLQIYDEIIPQIDRALGESASASSQKR